ncbi:dienelactone hydrolase family protein [Pseudoalteromonas sp. T1lg65]|uniref:dienelactone hydrolase family protein n=1 Tax=Pseudoalteromonas sp. T1lg65 TaxID=2077101 RepID=UPI003F798913
MKTLIITDIYGCTEHVKEFAEGLPGNTVIISPYHHEQFSVDEAYHYQRFIDTCGHQKYQEKVVKAIQMERPNLVIGFSAGGAAAWNALAGMRICDVQQLIAFYPSQIRNALNKKPVCDTELYFPISEPHFEVSEVISRLAAKKGVKCVRTRYRHGFMNRFSLNFDSHAYSHYLFLCKKEAESLLSETSGSVV